MSRQVLIVRIEVDNIGLDAAEVDDVIRFNLNIGSLVDTDVDLSAVTFVASKILAVEFGG